MGFIARAMRTKSADLSADLIRYIENLSKSKAGPPVTLDTALRVATFFACLRVISQGVAQVPWKLMHERRDQNTDLPIIRAARDHPLYDITSVQPNFRTTSFEFRETLTLHAACGNAFVFKSMAGEQIRELILLNPGQMEVEEQSDLRLRYIFTGKSGEKREIPAELIWHIRGPSWDGVLGLEVMQLAREALGLSIAAEETHSNLHANGVRPTGLYSVDGVLGLEQKQKLKQWLIRESGGSKGSGVVILDRGAKFISQAMTGLDAQHLEMRRHQIEEVCRFVGVMPIMIAHSDKTSTFASSEAFFDAHVKHTLAPWYARIEGSADVNLLTKKERQAGYYFKFVAAGLLRGTSKERAEYFSKALGSGGSPAWMTQDEVRVLEDFNPMGGEASLLPQKVAAPTGAPDGNQVP